MTPDGASTIMKSFDDDQIVKILATMKEAEAALILESISKGGEAEAKRAALISEKLRLTIGRKAKKN